MKRVLFFLCVFLVVISLALPAFASDGSEVGEGDIVSDPESTFLVPDVNVYNEVLVDNGDDLGTYVGSSVYALNPVSPSESNGLKAVMLSLIGDWDSIVVEHEYQSSQGYSNYVREIQLDYPWLCSCAIFLVVLFCILRGGFAVLCRQ